MTALLDTISNVANFLRGGAETAAHNASNFIRSAAISLDGKERFAGHGSLWKLTDSMDRVSGVLTTTWRLEASGLKQRFVGPDQVEYTRLMERIKNGVRWLMKLRHPGIVRVVSPLQEHRNGDLSFATERVTCSLDERMTQLKASRNSDAWAFVGDSPAPATPATTPASAISSPGTNNSNNKRVLGGSNNNQNHRSTPQSNAIQHFAPKPKPSQQQISIDEVLFGPPAVAAASRSTPNTTTNSTTTAGGAAGKSSVAAADDQPSESSMNMDALDEAEVVLLLRSVAEALKFTHNVAKVAHLNIAPESICVIRGTDDDVRAASLPVGSGSSGAAATKSGQFKEQWKICDFTFACLLSELDAIPASFCDHFVRVGGVRRLPATGLQGRSPGAGSAPPLGDSALTNRLVCPVLDFAAPEYVLLNKPCAASDLFSFAQLSFAVLRAAADPPQASPTISGTFGGGASDSSQQQLLLPQLPKSLCTSNDIALYEAQIALLAQPAATPTLGWEASSASPWKSAVHVDRMARGVSFDQLLASPDALGTAPAVALEMASNIAFESQDSRMQTFFQLHRSLPLMANGTCLRVVFPTLLTVADPKVTELHRYIAPLAIAAAAVVGKHLRIFSGRGAAGPAVGDALAVVVQVFRTLFATTDVHCAIVMLEEHAKVVPALTVIDDFTRDNSSFFGRPTPGWLSSLKERTKELTRSYIDMVLRAVRTDRINIAQPGVLAAATLLKHMSCGSQHELHPPANLSPDALLARREDVAAAEALLPYVAAHAFGTAPCNVGEQTRNAAAATTAAFVSAALDDRRKLQQIQEASMAHHQHHHHGAGGGGSCDREPTPLEVSVERRCNTIRDLFGMLIKLQASIQTCSAEQQRHWVLMIGAAGKMIRPQDVAAQVLGVLGNALIDSRMVDSVAQLAAQELKDFTAYLISTRKLTVK